MQNRNLKFVLLLFICIVLFNNIIAQDKAFFSLEEALKNPQNVEVLILGKKNQRCFPFYLCQRSDLPIPPEIAKFVNLRKLVLIYYLSSFIEKDGGSRVLSPEEESALLAPIFDLKNLTELVLVGNMIKNIPPGISKLKKLKRLDLSHNNIVSLPSEINELANLTELDLSFNSDGYEERTVILPEIFSLTNLERLILNNFKEKNLRLTSDIGGLKKLVELDLSNNQLENIPLGMENLTSLKKLNLESCCTSNNKDMHEFLSTKINKIKNLEDLNLRNNRLKKIPPNLWELKNLKKLNLSGNLLSEISTDIVLLSNLIELDLMDNLLKELPYELGKIKKLKRLRLSINNFGDIQTELDKVENVELYLSDIINTKDLFKLKNRHKNFIGLDMSRFYQSSSDLDKEIFELANLEKLNLSRNGIDELPSDIGKLKKLRILDLSSNKLKKLPIEFLELTNLEKLDLSLNHDISLLNCISELTNLNILKLTLGSDGHGNAKPTFPYSEIAKLIGLNLKELHLYEYCSVIIDIDLINSLLPNSILAIHMISGVNIESLPRSVREEGLNRNLLKTIEIILDANPIFGISVDDFLQKEVNENKNTITKQIEYRKKFIDFLNKKMKDAR